MGAIIPTIELFLSTWQCVTEHELAEEVTWASFSQAAEKIPRGATLVCGANYWRNPIHFSETTSEFPGFCGSYFTDVGRPRRQECRLIHCRR